MATPQPPDPAPQAGDSVMQLLVPQAKHLVVTAEGVVAWKLAVVRYGSAGLQPSTMAECPYAIAYHVDTCCITSSDGSGCMACWTAQGSMFCAPGASGRETRNMSDFTLVPDEDDPTPLQPALVPPVHPDDATAPLTGCMTCKAPRSYTVEPWPNGNTTWRCTACGQVLRLVPGKYLPDPEAPHE